MNPELLQKYIAGNATEAEKQRVTEWIQENPENMREYMAQRRLHDMALWRTEPVAEENSRERKHFSLRGVCMEAAKIAAVLAIVLLGTHYWTGKHQVPEDKTWQSIYVPAGQRAELMLADGTKVWLNSRSTLTFPGSFKGNIRNVKLDGEGYFAVTKNVEQPFIVETNKCNVKVLGTEFASDKSQHCAAIKMPLRVERRRRLRVRELTDKAFDIFNHMVVADKERTALVQSFRDDIQNTLFAIARFTARLFRQECHRVALIQQTQFAVRVAGGAWVEINTAFQQVTVEIRDQ